MTDFDTTPTNAEEKEARTLALSSPDYAKVKARNLAFIDMSRLKTMEAMAQTFINSGAMPKDWNAHKCVVAFQAAYERGMYPVEAINSFAFINGKITLYGDVVIARVLNAGHKISWGVYLDEKGEIQKMPCSATQASVTITRGDNGETLSAHMTMAEASKRRLDVTPTGTKKMPWSVAPDNMLKFKVFTMVQRFLVPDATMNMPVKEEIEADAIEGPTQIKAPENTTKTLDEVLAETDKETTEEITTPAPEEEPKKKSPKKAKKDTVLEATATVEEPITKPEETEGAAERYTRLVNEELDGKKLSDDDRFFLTSYRA